MPSSCGSKRNRRNRRSQGGANHSGASLHEAFANPKGEAFANPKGEAFANPKGEAFADAAKPEAFADAAKPDAMKGGRRKSGKRSKTRKLSKGASAWTQAVTKIYRQMKAKDKGVKLGDAMKRASALKKRGQL